MTEVESICKKVVRTVVQEACIMKNIFYRVNTLSGFLNVYIFQIQGHFYFNYSFIVKLCREEGQKRPKMADFAFDFVPPLRSYRKQFYRNYFTSRIVLMFANFFSKIAYFFWLSQFRHRPFWPKNGHFGHKKFQKYKVSLEVAEFLLIQDIQAQLTSNELNWGSRFDS